MYKDIENQFCIIDENNNIIQNHIEMTKKNLDIKNNNLLKLNKFKKSKSYPDGKIFFNLESKSNNETINIITNVNDINITLDTSTNLIENKTNIEYCKGYFSKFYYYCGINKINKIEILNKFLTICLHVFIMIVFEIYFYFNYVILIEKESFLEELQTYINQLNTIPLNSIQKSSIKNILVSIQFEYGYFIDLLYKQYIDSEESQKKILHKLLIKACTMAGIVGIILICLFLFELLKRKKIKWNWILIENLLMFVFLGIFEYFFFTNIIMGYNPITDAEIKYYVANGLIKYFNSTN